MNWSLEEAITYYQTQGAPRDQNALISLLREIQREHNGSIPAYMLDVIAAAYKIKGSLLHMLIKKIPSLRLADRHDLELCSGPNCGKHTALAAAAEKLTAARTDIQLKFVPCMRMCGKGPNIRWDGNVYHGMTEAKLKDLIGTDKL